MKSESEICAEGTKDAVLSETNAWIECAVIGLNLCPFAKAVYVKGQIRTVVADDTDTDALAHRLADELTHLSQTDDAVTDTTLIIAPRMLADFDAFNDFLGVADAVVDALGFRGVFQIASFHPSYQFDGTQPDDASNLTNRAPYPTLHILREASIGRAVSAFPDAEMIYEKNIEVVEALSENERNTVFPYLRRRLG